MAKPYEVKSGNIVYKSGKIVRHPNALWITLLVIGIVLFLLIPLNGLTAAVVGTRGICIAGGCAKYYGFRAFWDVFGILSIVFPYVYVVGLILIVVALVIRWKRKRGR